MTSTTKLAATAIAARLTIVAIVVKLSRRARVIKQFYVRCDIKGSREITFVSTES